MLPAVAIESLKPSPARCPLCGEENRCAIAAGSSEPCWCAGETFPVELLARVPAEAGPGRCVCRRCLEAFRASQPDAS